MSMEPQPLDEYIGVLLETKKSFSIEHRYNYGLDKQSGWSITFDGRVVAQFYANLANAFRQTLTEIGHDECLRRIAHDLWSKLGSTFHSPKRAEDAIVAALQEARTS